MSDVKIIRMLGIDDDIICKIQRCGGKYRIKDALIIRAIPVEKKKVEGESSATEQNPEVSFNILMAPMLMPYMNNEPLESDKCQIVFQISPTQEVEEKYHSVFSPIIKPNSNLILAS